MLRSDGKRPDGVTQIPWEDGKCLTWDVTVTNTLAASNLPFSSVSAGAAAEKAAGRKIQKYDQLTAQYTFVPVAFESLGPANCAGADFIRSIGSRTRAISGEIRETSFFLWQRLSVAVQRLNSICLHDTL